MTLAKKVNALEKNLFICILMFSYTTMQSGSSGIYAIQVSIVLKVISKKLCTLIKDLFHTEF